MKMIRDGVLLKNTMKNCILENCNEKHFAKGYCKHHYRTIYLKSNSTNNNLCDICKSNKHVTKAQNGLFLCQRHYAQFKISGTIYTKTRFDKNDIIINDSFAEIILYDRNCNEVNRTKISLDCVEMCSKHKWCVKQSGDNYPYVMTTIDGKKVRLHRFILDVKQHDLLVDHINHDTLDNRKENLRICTKKENCRNNKPQKNTNSGISGVIFSEQNQKWKASITVDREIINLGSFNLFEDALNCRLKAENKYFGEFAYQYSNDYIKKLIDTYDKDKLNINDYVEWSYNSGGKFINRKGQIIAIVNSNDNILNYLPSNTLMLQIKFHPKCKTDKIRYIVATVDNNLIYYYSPPYKNLKKIENYEGFKNLKTIDNPPRKYKGKLTENQIIEIFQMKENGLGTRKIAKIIGVSRGCINHILNIKEYKNKKTLQQFIDKDKIESEE
jgi:hypothetical protein